MKGCLKYIIYVAILVAIYWVVTMLVGSDCDHCGKKIFGDSYRIEGTSDVICESCARMYK